MNKNRSAIGKGVKTTLFYLFVALITLLFLFPFFVMITRSFMTWKEVVSVDVLLFSRHPSFDSYVTAMDPLFLRYLGNTLILIAIHVIFVPLSCFICAYGFAKCDFAGKNFWFAFGLGTTMLSGSVTGLPTYLLYVKLGFYGTYLPLIIPAFLGGGIINIFLVRQFLMATGKELDEAAMIDGANQFQRMFFLNMPIVFPILIFIAVNAFSGIWNDYKGPLVYLPNTDMYTISMGLYQKFFNNAGDVNAKANVQMATCVLMCIPPIIIFWVFQDRIIGGVNLMGSVKG